MTESNIEKLRVLDFDDTIANTTERVRIETPQGPKMISSAEFATYQFKQGESLDPDVAFEEFDSVDINSATPVPLVSDILKSFAAAASEGRKILILTARSQVVEPYILEFLEKSLGIKNANSFVDVVGVGDKDPIKKVEVISDYIFSNPTIKFVSFYDDSGKNVKAVKKYLDMIGIKSDVRQVVSDESGDVFLRKPDYNAGNLEESQIFNKVFKYFNKESHKMKITEARLKSIISEEVAEFLNENLSEGRAERRAARSASRDQMKLVKKRQKAVRRAIKLVRKMAMLEDKGQVDTDKYKKLMAEYEEIRKEFGEGVVDDYGASFSSLADETGDTYSPEEELESLEQLDARIVQDLQDDIFDNFEDAPDSPEGDEERSQMAMETKVIELPNDPYGYKVTMDDSDKIMNTGKLHFTIASGPKNKGKSFTLSDTSHPLYAKVKEVYPHLRDYLD